MKFRFSMVFIVCSFVSLAQDSTTLIGFENLTDQFLKKYVIDGYVDYASILNFPDEINTLVNEIGKMDTKAFNASEKQSFLINAYNILVIHQVVEKYPVKSVKDIPGFFDRIKFLVGGQELTLNQIEKDILLKEFKDSRFHIVLVCGAKDCPKLWNRAYRAQTLEAQMVERSKAVLNDPLFVKEVNNEYLISEIFKWNRFEFGGKSGSVAFINQYRDAKISETSTVIYYDYDWTLNDIKFKGNTASQSGNNAYRYVTSAAIPKGGMEIKVFNNLYSQVEGPGEADDFRATYFTTSLSFLYGINNRFNLGFASRYRRVLRNQASTSPFDALGDLPTGKGRQRITAFGPQIRWAPFRSLPNFSIQSQFTFPIGDQLSGGDLGPFLDWAGPVFWTQFFNDHAIGDKFSLFTEVDLLLEEIGGSGKANRVSTPMTVIMSWFPKKNFTIYGLVGYSPIIANPYDYFYQIGVGTKYQLSPNFEVELLLTDFSNRFLKSVNGSAATYNLGFRYSR